MNQRFSTYHSIPISVHYDSPKREGESIEKEQESRLERESILRRIDREGQYQREQ